MNLVNLAAHALELFLIKRTWPIWNRTIVIHIMGLALR